MPIISGYRLLTSAYAEDISQKDTHLTDTVHAPDCSFTRGCAIVTTIDDSNYAITEPWRNQCCFDSQGWYGQHHTHPHLRGSDLFCSLQSSQSFYRQADLQ